MSASLSNFENKMYDKIEDLLSSCRDFCGEKPFIDVPSLRENTFYKNCEYCIIKTFLDSVDAPTYSLSTIEGKYLEYIVLDDYVVEVGEEYVQFIHIDNIIEYVGDLVEFNVLDGNSANELVAWLSAFLKK